MRKQWRHRKRGRGAGTDREVHQGEKEMDGKAGEKVKDEGGGGVER